MGKLNKVKQLTYISASCLQLARLSVLDFSRGQAVLAWFWVGTTGFV